MAPASRLAAVLVVCGLGLGACGAASKDSAKDFKGDQRKVAQVVEDLEKAGRRGDEDKICSDLLAPKLVDAISAASSSSCADALHDRLTDTDVFKLDVKKVTITGDRATAVVRSSGGDPDRTDTLGLQRVGGAWKIATLG